MLLRPLLLSLAGSLLHAADTRLVRESEALTPEQERMALRVPDGFEVQVFASDPMIQKPINLAFDQRGRLWVSSTAEYPYAAAKERWSDSQGTRVEGSRDAIKILEDTDGDGRADKVIDFADGLNIPTGVLPWHKPEHKAGCIAWSIPNIWYFADTDGDDKADHREVLFGPLGYEKDTHGMCSSFRLGLDGWVYATHGFNNTSHIRPRFTKSTGSAREPSVEAVELHSGNVFRFKPDGSKVEVWTRGQVNPFGLDWDRYGNLYSADCHSAPVYQLIRGAFYPSFGKPHDGLGFAPVMCEHTHGSTGICGIVYLDGGVWGPEWNDQILIGNVVTSRINRDRVRMTGSTPKAEEQPDFIISDDPWFRPVDLQLGPDHAIYVADFYNRIIGHYEVPLDHPGRDRERGRIWRIVKKDVPRPATMDFTSLSAMQIAEELGNANATRRRLALREVQQRGDATWLSALTPVSAGDARPKDYPMGDTEPHDFTPLKLNWPSSDLRLAHTLWALSYLGERFAVASVLRDRFSNGERESDGLIMAHAAQILGTYPQLHPWEKWMLGSVFDHRDNTAGRATASVLLNRSNFLTDAPAWQGQPIEKLIRFLHRALEVQSTHPDTHYVHALRLLLRDWLSQPKVFHNTFWQQRTKDAQNAAWFKDLIIATPGAHVSRYLCERAWNDTPDALRQIGTHGDDSSLRDCLNRLDSQPSDQATRDLQALYEGLQISGRTMPPEFHRALISVSERLLTEVATQDAPKEWIETPHPESPGSASPWGYQVNLLPDQRGKEFVITSLNRDKKDAESLTGILRSKVFEAPAQLKLWLSGHRGPPNRPAHDRNLVRVIDAISGAALATAYPPRHDLPHPTELDLSAHAGKRVRLELVDGDAGNAYAWLALNAVMPPVVSLETFQGTYQAQENLRILAQLLPTSAPATLRERLAPYQPPRAAPPPLQITPEQRQQLDVLIAQRVAAFTQATPQTHRGQQLFTTHCTACHQIGGRGGLIGPQLDGIGTRGAARLTEDILDPNRNVDAHFHLHILTLKDGNHLSGFLKAEAGQVLILTDPAGQEQRVSKGDIVTDTVQPLSLMPSGFGQTLNEADFIDLLGWLLHQ